MTNFLYLVRPAFRYAIKPASMRLALLLAFFFVLGYKKENKPNYSEVPRCRLALAVTG